MLFFYVNELVLFEKEEVNQREIHFGSRVHMHPVWFSKFKKYENISKKSEKNLDRNIRK